MGLPDRPKIYHIVHVDCLAGIVADGCLWCDAEMMTRPEHGTTIGMDSIKKRRLELPVKCHPGSFVGHYVPFYFCPRSVMLYMLYMANHPELKYRGGQEPIVHLEADLREAVQWAETENRRWAFTLSNAAAKYAEFRSNINALGEIKWSAVEATVWRKEEDKEHKQAEFLVHRSFPWRLVRHIGVHSFALKQQVEAILQSTDHRPPVQIHGAWYY